MSKRYIGFGLILAQMGLIFLVIQGVRQRPQQHPQEAKLKAESMQEAWGRGEFVDIPNQQDLLEAKLERTIGKQIANANSIKDQAPMKQELVHMISQMLLAFSTGNPESYRAFHFPLPAQSRGVFDQERMGIIRRAAKKESSFRTLGDIDRASDEDVFVSWGGYLAKSQPPERRDCSDCWKRVNFDKIGVLMVAATNTTQLDKVRFAIFVPHLFDDLDPWLTTSAFNSVIDYSPSIKDLYKRDGSVLVACVRVPVRTSVGIAGVYPMYASLYWIPDDRKWIPIGLSTISDEMNVRIWF